MDNEQSQSLSLLFFPKNTILILRGFLPNVVSSWYCFMDKSSENEEKLENFEAS